MTGRFINMDNRIVLKTGEGQDKNENANSSPSRDVSYLTTLCSFDSDDGPIQDLGECDDQDTDDDDVYYGQSPYNMSYGYNKNKVNNLGTPTEKTLELEHKHSTTLKGNIPCMMTSSSKLHYKSDQQLVGNYWRGSVAHFPDSFDPNPLYCRPCDRQEPQYEATSKIAPEILHHNENNSTIVYDLITFDDATPTVGNPLVSQTLLTHEENRVINEVYQGKSQNSLKPTARKVSNEDKFDGRRGTKSFKETKAVQLDRIRLRDYNEDGDNNKSAHLKEWKCANCTLWNPVETYVCQACCKSNQNLYKHLKAKDDQLELSARDNLYCHQDHVNDPMKNPGYTRACESLNAGNKRSHNQFPISEAPQQRTTNRTNAKNFTKSERLIQKKCAPEDEFVVLQVQEDDDNDSGATDVPPNKWRCQHCEYDNLNKYNVCRMCSKTKEGFSINVIAETELTTRDSNDANEIDRNKQDITEGHKKRTQQNAGKKKSNLPRNVTGKPNSGANGESMAPMETKENYKAIYRRLLAEGLSTNREKADMAAKLISVGYDEKMAIYISEKYDSIDEAKDELSSRLSYLKHAAVLWFSSRKSEEN